MKKQLLFSALLCSYTHLLAMEVQQQQTNITALPERCLQIILKKTFQDQNKKERNRKQQVLRSICSRFNKLIKKSEIQKWPIIVYVAADNDLRQFARPHESSHSVATMHSQNTEIKMQDLFSALHYVCEHYPSTPSTGLTIWPHQR